MDVGKHFVFGKLTKCASSYIEICLRIIDHTSKNTQDLNFKTTNRTGRADYPLALVKDQIGKDTTKVWFVPLRNPYDWYVSMWKYASGPAKWFRNYKDFEKFMLHILTEYDGFVHRRMDFSIMLKHNIGWYTFEFIHAACELNVYENIDDFKENPMKYVVTDKFYWVNDGTEFIDWYREHIHDVPDNIVKRVREIERKNETVHDYWDTYYTSELKKLVEEKDAVIFKIYKQHTKELK